MCNISILYDKFKFEFVLCNSELNLNENFLLNKYENCNFMIKIILYIIECIRIK